MKKRDALKCSKMFLIYFSVSIAGLFLTFTQDSFAQWSAYKTCENRRKAEYSSSDLVIQSYQLVSKTNVKKAGFDYTFKAVIKNNGTKDAVNVFAALTSLDSAMTIIDGSLSFDIVPAGASINSSDTFTVQIDKRHKFHHANLNWSINAEFPEAYKIIGTEGGVVNVLNADSELNGTKVDISPSALRADTVISIKQEDIAISMPEETTNAGVIIDLGPDGIVFDNNILVTIPYDDADNDGIVDYTGISEDELTVVTWDKAAQAWINVNVVGQDKQNNTITFETKHFSKYTTSAKCDYSDKNVIIATIDGLKFTRTFGYEIFGDYPLREAYLKKALLEMGLGLKRCDVISYGGDSYESQSWDGDAKKTSEIINSINWWLFLYDDLAKKQGKKLILITHSWGTQLGELALRYMNIAPDLFITLSAPAGSNLVNESNYTNTNFYRYYSELFGGYRYITVKEAQSEVEDYVAKRKQETYDRNGNPTYDVTAKKWINYWDAGDLFSGPLNSNNSNSALDDRIVIGGDQRDLVNTEKVHAITSLCCEKEKDSAWKEYNVVEEGKKFRDKVKADIEAVIGNPPDFIYVNSPNGEIFLNTWRLYSGVSIRYATRIYCSLRVSYDGSIPPDPPAPTVESHDNCVVHMDTLGSGDSCVADNGEYLTCSTGPFELFGDPGEYKRIKIRFSGYNSAGYTVSDVYSYLIDNRMQ